MTERCIAFDAYGTLFDVYSIGALAEALYPGHGARIAELWRVAQVDVTRIRTLSGQYRDFRAVTVDALRFALAKLGLNAGAEQIDRLMGQYAELTAFPENHDVLRALKAEGHRLAILSNGTPEMLQCAIAAADMGGLFEHVLSADAVKKFKTAPEVYQLAPDAFGVPARDIVFVSSNGWDACGATWFGFETFWVNRSGTIPDPLGVKPNHEGRDLNDLLRLMRR
jgi:2-haloacid dehalogenase